MNNKILDWILRSSADPKKLSLTLKAGVPFLLIFFGWFGWGNDAVGPLLNEGIEQIVNLIALVGAGITGIQGVYGLVRKVIKTFRGTNGAVQ